MAGLCSCDVVLGNTGLSGCPSLPQVTIKIILVPYFDANGNINEFDLTDPAAPTYGGVTGTGLNAAFFSDLVNNADKNGRLYPLPNIKNASDVRDTPVFETFDDGSSEFVKDGIATFTAVITNRSPKFLAQLKAAKCTPLGAYLVDDCDNLIGYSAGKNKLQPLRIDENTWAPSYERKLSTTVPKIAISFQWAQTLRDEQITMISADDITAPISSLTGLLDIVECALVANSATELKVDLATNFGTVGNPEKIEGLTVAELSVYNETTGLAVVPVSVAEAPAGCYTVTIPAQTAGDVLHIEVVKAGLDDTQLQASQVAAL